MSRRCQHALPLRDQHHPQAPARGSHSVAEARFSAREVLVLAPAAAANALLAGKRCHTLLAEALLEELTDLVLAGSGSTESVLVGDLGEGLDYARLNRAFRLLMDGAELVAPQRNRFWQEADGPSLDAGPFVAALEYPAARPRRWSGSGSSSPPSSKRPWGLRTRGEGRGDGRRRCGARRGRGTTSGATGCTGKDRQVPAGSGGEADGEIESIADLPAVLGL